MPGVVGPSWHPGRSGLWGRARVRSATVAAAAMMPSVMPTAMRSALRTTRERRRSIGYSRASRLLHVAALVRKPCRHGPFGALADLDVERLGAEHGVPGLERVAAGWQAR